MAASDRPLGPEDDSAADGQLYVNLAFVLLSKARLPQPGQVVQEFGSFARPGELIELDESQSSEKTEGQIFSLSFNTGETSFVTLAPMPVPEREADEAVRFSLSSFKPDWELPSHCAHLLVTMQGAAEPEPLAQLSRFTALVAAVIKCSPAIGVYWGNAGATHEAEFFLALAQEPHVIPRIVLWSGLSIAREDDGRLSLLSLGMEQLKLPNLLLVAGRASENVAIETLYDMLAYIAERGEPIREGETVGRALGDRWPVRYVPSPIDPDKTVWRVEMP